MSRIFMRRCGVVAIASALALGCTGNIQGDGPSSPGSGSATAGTSGTPAVAGDPDSFEDAAADSTSAGPLPLRLLTRDEYDNTTQDLLGQKLAATTLFPSESQAETGFSKVQKVDQVSVAAYQEAALTLAQRATQNLPTLMGCDATAGNEAACVQSFLESFGPRVYRRPLAAAELTEHLSWYQTTLRSELSLGVGDAVRLLLAGMLSSPHFLYRWELGSEPAAREGQVVALNAYHLASQLSYFLWASMPDAALFAAAAAQQLQTPADVQLQVRRMLTDPKAERTVARFHEQWLGLSALPQLGKSEGRYPTWNPELGAAMAEEVRRFTANVLLHGDGRFATLLSARSSFVNQPLAELYGMTGIAGTELVSAELPANQRAGLLTLAGFLTAHSGETEASPILRGKFLRERLLCDPMPPPPDGIPPLPAPAADVSIKQRHLQHAQVSPCKDCHLRMDYIGFGLDNYDALGAYHELDGALPIDASGQVTDLDGANPTFSGPLELMTLLASSEQVRTCLAKEWFRYAFARRELGPDRASFEGAYAAFAGSTYDIRELLAGLTTTRSFRYRSIDEGEVLP